MTGRPAAFIAFALASTASVADSEIAEIRVEIRGRVDMRPCCHELVTWAIGYWFDVAGITPIHFRLVVPPHVDVRFGPGSELIRVVWLAT